MPPEHPPKVNIHVDMRRATSAIDYLGTLAERSEAACEFIATMMRDNQAYLFRMWNSRNRKDTMIVSAAPALVDIVTQAKMIIEGEQT